MRQLEKLVARIAPRPDVPSTLRALPRQTGLDRHDQASSDSSAACTKFSAVGTRLGRSQSIDSAWQRSFH